MTFLQPFELALTARLNKHFNELSECDHIWKLLYLSHLQAPSFGSVQTQSRGGDEEGNGQSEESDLSWKTRYRLSREWQWDRSPSGKAIPLEVSNMHRTVSRPSQDGINPIVRTTKPFTKYRNYIEIIVEEVGTWFRCGVADVGVALDDGNLLGGQGQGTFNMGYCKSGSIYYSFRGKMDKTLPSPDVRKRVVSGCRIGIHWDQPNRTFFFYFDGQLIASLELTHREELTSIDLFPTIQLSYTSKVTIHHKFCHKPSFALPGADQVSASTDSDDCACAMDM